MTSYLNNFLFITEKSLRVIRSSPPSCWLSANRRHLFAIGICESEFAVAVMVPFSDRRRRYAFASRREGKWAQTLSSSSSSLSKSAAIVASRSEKRFNRLSNAGLIRAATTIKNFRRLSHRVTLHPPKFLYRVMPDNSRRAFASGTHLCEEHETPESFKFLNHVQTKLNQLSWYLSSFWRNLFLEYSQFCKKRKKNLLRCR